ncbi:MAG: Ig-like domain-containing protein, partial [Thermoplasmata archaeon]|nr:Ig-like domain-containing protein [Thermoplasmata archaeon]
MFDVIHEGASIVCYRGHGGITGWGGGVRLDRNDVMGLENGDMLPVVISIACLNSQFDYQYGDCIAEAWLKAPNGGAVASIAAADISWHSYNNFMAKEAFSAVFLEQETTLGHVVNHFKIATLDRYGTNNNYALHNVWMYTLMGDPEMDLVGMDIPDHDISVSDMKVPSIVELGQTAAVTAKVTNRGVYGEQDITVEFLVDDVVMDSYFMPYVASRYSEVLEFAWAPTVEGEYTLSVRATLIPGDENPGNNQADRSVTAEVGYPYAEACWPKDGATEVDGKKVVQIDFNEAMDKTSVENAFSITPNVPGEITWSDTNCFLFTPLEYYTAATTYTVTIDATATDLYGNGIDGNGDGVPGDDFVFRFTTDSLPPYVCAVSPSNGELNVPSTTAIRITFNEIVDYDSVGNALIFDPPVAGTWESGYGTVFEFTPDSLDASTIYYVVMGQGVVDRVGNVMVVPHTWSFTTASTYWSHEEQATTEDGDHYWPAVDVDAGGN